VKSNDGFQFRQFYVRHDRCAMKVGTDGVLVGCLCPGPASAILDLGCGTGLIALMLAQRFPEARIVGIDIDAAAAAQAADNFAASPWADRLTALCADARSYAARGGGDSLFELIVCNPPFYANSPAASSAARDRARRTDTLTYEDLALTAERLLTDGGRLGVIVPYGEAADFIHTCWLHGLHLLQRTDIRTAPSKPFKRCFIIFEKTVENKDIKTHVLTLLNADGTRSEEYRTLTREYYLFEV